jgi:colanic acid/amylovoran biosynthesis glycosyltransferase
VVQDGAGGYLVPERDSQALAQRLRELALHPERWPAMGSAGRRHIEQNYDIHKAVESLACVYDELRR